MVEGNSNKNKTISVDTVLSFFFVIIIYQYCKFGIIQKEK